jgi:hypothetical protein
MFSGLLVCCLAMLADLLFTLSGYACWLVFMLDMLAYYAGYAVYLW